MLPLPSFIDSARKKLFVSSPNKTERQEPFRIDWLDYDTIKNEAKKYSTGTDGSQEKFDNILSFLLNQFTPPQIKFAFAAKINTGKCIINYVDNNISLINIIF
jgi:hypothetical protein